ncbi:MAG: response regulator transcription factor [Caldilineaceae bacterium]|nr:response regulator transcription factor [Caldilineaceae bacterium]MCB0094635.1 response regulator transcription factor [Caldilineaceae bacterium]
MENYKILVVDDDRKTVELIRLYLEREGYIVITAYDGRQALDLIRQRKPDLVVLDLMLPLVSGLDICRILALETRIPIVMLTAKTTEEDILLGLDLGADDYVTKPFSPRQLVARVRSVLRRAYDTTVRPQGYLTFGNLQVDPVRHEVRIDGEPLPLTPREFKMLETLAREPGRAFTRLELLERVFGYDYKGLERTVDAHIMNLRKKLMCNQNGEEYIQTVYGIGYKFASDARHV